MYLCKRHLSFDHPIPEGLLVSFLRRWHGGLPGDGDFMQEEIGAGVPGGSISSIDFTPGSGLDQGDYYCIALNGEDRSIPPNTKRVKGTA